MEHFEDLWEKCESTYSKENTEDLLKELSLKIKLLQSVLKVKDKIKKEQYTESVSRLMGELLFITTQISMSENVNVFTALKNTFYIKSIDELSILTEK